MPWCEFFSGRESLRRVRRRWSLAECSTWLLSIITNGNRHVRADVGSASLAWHMVGQRGLLRRPQPVFASKAHRRRTPGRPDPCKTKFRFIRPGREERRRRICAVRRAALSGKRRESFTIRVGTASQPDSVAHCGGWTTSTRNGRNENKERPCERAHSRAGIAFRGYLGS